MAILSGVEVFFEHINDKPSQACGTSTKDSTLDQSGDITIEYKPSSSSDSKDLTTRFIALIPQKRFQIVFRVMHSSSFYGQNDFKLNITFDRGAKVHNAEVYVSRRIVKGATQLKRCPEWDEVRISRIVHHANQYRFKESSMSTELLTRSPHDCHAFTKPTDTGDIEIEVRVGRIVAKFTSLKYLEIQPPQAQSRNYTKVLQKQGICSEITLTDPLNKPPQQLGFIFSLQKRCFKFSFRYRTPLSFFLYKLGDCVRKSAGENPDSLQRLLGFEPADFSLLIDSVFAYRQPLGITEPVGNSEHSDENLGSQQSERADYNEIDLLLSQAQSLEQELEQTRVEEAKLIESYKTNVIALEEERVTQDRAHQAKRAELELERRQLTEKCDEEKQEGAARIQALQKEISKLGVFIQSERTEHEVVEGQLQKQVKESRATMKDLEEVVRRKKRNLEDRRNIFNDIKTRKRPRTDCS